MRVLFSMLFFIFCLGSVYGFDAVHGNLIKGAVTDEATGERLAGASVVLNQGAIGTKTDLLGNFEFDNLQDGTYSITVTFIGYAPTTLEVTLSQNETKTIAVRLSPASLNLHEVTITDASSTEDAMTTINKIDIELRPLKSSQDVLRMIPGLVTAQHAGGGKAEQIFLRGFDIDHGTDIALTVDGMPVNMVSHAHGQGYADLHFVIPELIDHVDFNKGPYYANTGDFNTAGYANFVTKKTLEKSSVKLEAGRFDTWRTVALLDLLDNEQKNQHAYAAAEYHYTNGPFVSPQNFSRLNLFGKYHGMIGDDKLVEVSLSTFKSQWDASGQIPERAVSQGHITRFGAIDDTEGGRTGRTNANFTMTKLLPNGSSIRNQIYLSHYDFELYSNFTFFLNDPVNGDGILQKEDRNIYGYKGTYHKAFLWLGNPVTTESGIGIRYDNVTGSELSHVQGRNTFLNPITLGDINQINGSIYTEGSMQLTPQFSVTAGIRLDAFSFQYADALLPIYNRQVATQAIASPKLNLYYNVTPSLQLYIKNGIGFHSNDSRVVVSQHGVEILPKAYGTDIGLFAKPVQNLLLNVAAWQLRLEQEFVYVGDEAVVEISGETQRYGLDLSLRYQMADWLYLDLDGNYAHGRSVAEPEGENLIPLAPTLTSIGGISTSWRNGLRASIRYRYVGDRPANEDNSVRALGHFLLDAGVSYTTRSFQLAVNATNLLNEEWNEAQFDTETRLPWEAQGISELTFTPGDPFFIKAAVTIYF